MLEKELMWTGLVNLEGRRNVKIKRGTNRGTKKCRGDLNTDLLRWIVQRRPWGATAVVVEDFRESIECRIGKQKRGDCSDEGEPCKAVCYSLVLLTAILFCFVF